MKSSFALVIEQLLLLDSFWELDFEVVFSFDSLSLLPLLLSVAAAGAVTFFVFIASAREPGGGEVCRGVSKELNGTSGITKSPSLTIGGLLITNAPTFIVSLKDLEVSSLEDEMEVWNGRCILRKGVRYTFADNGHGEGLDPNESDRFWA